MKARTISRRAFTSGVSGLTASMLAALAVSPSVATRRSGKILDAHMHLEAYGTYWEGLEDQIIEHYDYAGIDRGVVFTAWTPSRESNERTLAAYRKYPDRFIPFGHIRTEDPDWERELERIGEWGWKGIKLHQNEISRGADLEEKTRLVVKKASDSGIGVVLIHLEDVDMIKRLAEDFRQVKWIIPHMGSYKNSEEMKSYCELARDNGNLFLDTSGAQYHRFGQQFRWAGIEKILFASDGFWFSPHVERAKIEILQLPTPFRTPKLTDQELDLILGGNLARILQRS